MAPETWAGRLAESLLFAYKSEVPADVLERASLQILDTFACAAGAQGGGPASCVLDSIDHDGGDAAVWFTGRSASVGDAVLANGTAVRYLDANDVFLGLGPGGHPSDNIPVAIGAAGRFRTRGRDVLVSVALAYELVYRLRNEVFRATPLGPTWHEVSMSGLIAAILTALLGGATQTQLSNAISIGAARGYTLKEVRRGRISMLKAAANASVAREGVMAGMLALNGMTGPPEVFEGADGLMATMGGEAQERTVVALAAPPTWAISSVSIKPYPALGTSQAAIAAAVTIAQDISDPSSIDRVEIRLKDSPWSRDYMTLEERRAPSTRETADHSLHFLVAIALLDGDVTQHDYEARRWEEAQVRSIMARTSVVPDVTLNRETDATFPAEVVVALRDGSVISERILDVPGSPQQPWGLNEILEKFARLDRAGLAGDHIRVIGERTMKLSTAESIDDLVQLIR